MRARLSLTCALGYPSGWQSSNKHLADVDRIGVFERRARGAYSAFVFSLNDSFACLEANCNETVGMNRCGGGVIIASKAAAKVRQGVELHWVGVVNCDRKAGRTAGSCMRAAYGPRTSVVYGSYSCPSSAMRA